MIRVTLRWLRSAGEDLCMHVLWHIPCEFLAF